MLKAGCVGCDWVLVLQEVQVKGQDVVFKDVIEPLESVSVNIIKTDKTSLAELGSPQEVR